MTSDIRTRSCVLLADKHRADGPHSPKTRMIAKRQLRRCRRAADSSAVEEGLAEIAAIREDAPFVCEAAVEDAPLDGATFDGDEILLHRRQWSVVSHTSLADFVPA